MKKSLFTLAVIAAAFIAQAGGKDCPSSKQAAACPQSKAASAACADKAKAGSCEKAKACCASASKKALLSPKATDAKR